MQNVVELETIYAGIPGGPELLAWFGCVPSFHDAEIVSLTLNRRAPSILRIHGLVMGKDSDGLITSSKRAVVTFTLDGVMDVELNGFSRQNVIDCLRLVHAPARADHQAYYTLDASPEDYEIQLEPCYGMDGVIRCKKVSVSFTPGKPQDADE